MELGSGKSLQETMANKLIALAYRSWRIKPRDIGDIVWLKQRGIDLSNTLVEKKPIAKQNQAEGFQQALSVQLMTEDEVCHDCNMEVSRFIPKQIKERTLDNPEY